MKKLIFIFLLLLSLNCHAGKVRQMYDSLLKYKVYEPEISLCIIIFETKWMTCDNCTLDNNNFFAFRWKEKYKVFRDHKHAILYYKKWQTTHWLYYKRKHPGQDYYSFLKWIKYAPNMDNYNKQLKLIQSKLSFLK